MRQTFEEPTRYDNLGFFVANRSSTIVFPPSTLVNIAFDTAVFNDNGCFDFGQQKFIAPKAGRLSVSLAYSVASTGTTDLYLITNCTNAGLKNDAITFATSLTNGSRFSYSNSFVANVNVGSTLYLAMFSTGATVNTNLLAEECCYMNAFYLT